LIFHIFAQDSASTVGAGKASIAFGSWACRYIRNGEAISGAITPEDITTIGTYAAPTANTNIRIKAVDNTNMIGVYEVQIHLDWVNATNTCQSLTIYLTATGVAVLPIQIPLRADDIQAAKPTNFSSLSIDGSGRVDVIKVAGTTQTAGDVTALVVTAATYIDTEVAAIKTKTDFLPSATAGAAGGLFIAGANAATSITTALTANVIGNITGNLSGSVGSVTAGVTLAAAAVQAIWDALTSALTTVGSIGKKLADWTIGTAPTVAQIRTEMDDNSTKLAAIKAKTDSLTFTQSGHVDANIQMVNDVGVVGTGAEGDRWGPA
jgi:hypothetical protein